MLFRKDPIASNSRDIVPASTSRADIAKPLGSGKLVVAQPGKSPFEGVKGDGAVLVGKGAKSSGEIRDASVIEIQGDFEGDVTATTVIVRQGATFKGNMQAEYVEVHGIIEGSLIAEQLLDIRATGLIMAEVRYGQLCVATGGRLSGTIQTQTFDGTAEEQDSASVAPRTNGTNGAHYPYAIAGDVKG